MTHPDPYGLVGQVLDGQFRVDRFVGEGGFSTVYQGTHVGLTEPIAIKCLKLPPALGSALVESFIRRFRDESRIQYRLSQGNLHIVRSMASGTTIAPATSALVPYTVLEWLEGRSLADEFNARRAAGLSGRSLIEGVQLLDTAVDALAYAHAQGVVHRDLNPGNFFLARTPVGVKMKVLDFGVAKVMVDSAIAMGPTARTVGNVRIFAPAYGAPEQFDERVGAVGPWTDVYALALVVLEALTDRTVMEGEHLGQFAEKALYTAVRPGPRSLGVAVGDEVEKVFVRALAVNPTDRPRDAGEWWGLLKNSMQRDATAARASDSAADRVDRRLPAVTLRISESVPLWQPAIEMTPLVRRGQSSRPPGGTLRMERDPKRSASEALAATPVPPRASQISSPRPPAPPADRPPAPVGPLAPSGADPGADMTIPGLPRSAPVIVIAAIVLGLVATLGIVSLVRSHDARPAPGAAPTTPAPAADTPREPAP